MCNLYMEILETQNHIGQTTCEEKHFLPVIFLWDCFLVGQQECFFLRVDKYTCVSKHRFLFTTKYLDMSLHRSIGRAVIRLRFGLLGAMMSCIQPFQKLQKTQKTKLDLTQNEGTITLYSRFNRIYIRLILYIVYCLVYC